MTDASVTRAPIAVDVHGSGPRAVLVHGSVLAGTTCWQAQLPLADQFRLVLPYRRGHHPNPPVPAAELSVDTDAEDVAALLGDGAHLVGQSIGALIALLAAARRPDRVRSLVVNEPPLPGLVPDHPDAVAQRTRLGELLTHPPVSDAEFLYEFETAVGSPARHRQDPLPDDLAQNVALLRGSAGAARPVPEAELALLRAEDFPKVVVSGGHGDAQEALADELARRIGAERAVVRGAGHRIPRTGEPYNDLLRRTWSALVPDPPAPAPEEARR
jgi:pimeloyl-ACP methyl ester carboxylesterase